MNQIKQASKHIKVVKAPNLVTSDRLKSYIGCNHG